MRANARTVRYLRHDAEVERPYSLQIFGGEPEVMAQAALVGKQWGAQIIDINMGCPVKKVTKNGAGSALLCDPAAGSGDRPCHPRGHRSAGHGEDPQRLGRPAPELSGDGRRPGGGRLRGARGPSSDARPGLRRAGGLVGDRRPAPARADHDPRRERRREDSGRREADAGEHRLRPGDDWPRRAGEPVDLPPARGRGCAGRGRAMSRGAGALPGARDLHGRRRWPRSAASASTSPGTHTGSAARRRSAPR